MLDVDQLEDCLIVAQKVVGSNPIIQPKYFEIVKEYNK